MGRKASAIVLITVVLFAVAFSGCTEKKSAKDPTQSNSIKGNAAFNFIIIVPYI